MRSYPRYIFEHSSWLYSAQNLPFTFSAVVQEVYSNDYEWVDLLGRHIVLKNAFLTPPLLWLENEKFSPEVINIFQNPARYRDS